MVNSIHITPPTSVNNYPFVNTNKKLKGAAECAMHIYAKTTYSEAHPMFPQYFPELIDKKHRYAKLIYPYFQKWKDDISTCLNFTQWLEEQEKTDLKLGELPQVKYLSESERKEYELQIKSDGVAYTYKEGPLKKREDPKHPYIYVIGPDGKMYVGIRDNGHFNHSSFLGGRPVICAGELTIKDGKIETITDTSGHYKTFARPKMLFNGVQAMVNIGLKDFRVICQAQLKNKKEFKTPLAYLNTYKFSHQYNALIKEYNPILEMDSSCTENQLKKENDWIIWRNGHTIMMTKKMADRYLHQPIQETSLETLKKMHGQNLITFSI